MNDERLTSLSDPVEPAVAHDESSSPRAGQNSALVKRIPWYNSDLFKTITAVLIVVGVLIAAVDLGYQIGHDSTANENRVTATPYPPATATPTPTTMVVATVPLVPTATKLPTRLPRLPNSGAGWTQEQANLGSQDKQAEQSPPETMGVWVAMVLVLVLAVLCAYWYASTIRKFNVHIAIHEVSDVMNFAVLQSSSASY